MGAVSSYFSRKVNSSRIETDPFIQISTRAGEMAESRTREIARQQINEPWTITDEISKHSTALHEVQEFINRAGMMLERQRRLETELETCHERLKRFTGDHARQNESNVENITSTNSPSTLERNYEQFYDHERMDAVDAIENSRLKKRRDKLTEIDDKYTACLIFEESYAAAEVLHKSFLEGMSLLVTSAPATGAQYLEASKKQSGELRFSIQPRSHNLGSKGQIIENSLKVIMKETAENCDADALMQRTLACLRKLQENGTFGAYANEFFLKPQLKKFIERSCKYAWKLVCQTPPYVIQGNLAMAQGGVFDSAHHQLSKDFEYTGRTSDYVSAVLWPGLFEGASGRVIRKTEVLLEQV